MYLEEHRIDGLKLQDAIKKLRERPYEQYKEEPVEGVEPIKNEKLANKTKLRKYIKKIKVQTLKGDDDEEDTYKKLAPSIRETDPSIEDVTPTSPLTKQNNPFRIN